MDTGSYYVYRSTFHDRPFNRPNRPPIISYPRKIRTIKPQGQFVIQKKPPIIEKKPTDEDKELNVPGLKNVFDKNKSIVKRILWMIAILLCTSICIYQVGDRLSYYFQRPTYYDAHVTRNSTVRFPAFTLCPYGLDETPVFHEAREELAKKKNLKDWYSVSIWEVMDDRKWNVKEMWSNNTISLEDLIVKFQLKKRLPLRRPLPKIQLEKKVAFLGTCVQFSIDGEVDFLGAALTITVSLKNKSSFEEFPMAFSAYGHEDNVSIKHHAFFKGNIIPRGFMTSIGIGISEFRVLNTSKTRCEDTRTVATCWTECYAEKIRSGAICRLPYMNHEKERHLPECASPVEAEVVFNQTLDVYMNTLLSDCPCRTKCIDKVFTMNLDVRYKTENKTLIEIFFQDNLFEVIQEKYSFSFIALLCDIGGNLGLYLGFCLLTVLEILELLLDKVKRRCDKSTYDV